MNNAKFVITINNKTSLMTFFESVNTENSFRVLLVCRQYVETRSINGIIEAMNRCYLCVEKDEINK